MTLDVVTKAQIALSSQVNKSIDRRYEDLKRDLKNGTITESQAQDYYYNLREKAKRPEEVNQGNAKESLDFIFDDNVEKFIREKSALELKAKEGEKAIKKLRLITAEKNKKRKKPYKVLSALLYFVSLLALMAIVILIPYSIWKIISLYKTDQDTPIALGGLLIALALEIFGLFKLLRPIHKWLKTAIKKQYLKLIPIE